MKTRDPAAPALSAGHSPSAESPIQAKTGVADLASSPSLSGTLQRAAADPRSLSRADAVMLQRTVGNAAVGQLVSRSSSPIQRVVIPVGELANNNIATSQQTVNHVQEEQAPINGTNYSVHFHANNYHVNAGPAGPARNLTSITATFNNQAGGIFHVTWQIQNNGAWGMQHNQGPVADQDKMEAVLMGKMDALRDMNGNQF